MNIPSLFQPGWKWCGIALLCGALFGALAGWWVTDNKYTADIATIKQQHAEDIKAISDDASAQRDKNAALEHALANAIAKRDQQHSQELTDALAKNQALRDAVTSGARQLRLAKAGLATCNLSKGSVAGSPGVGDGTEIQFSPDFGRNIYDIRSGAITDQAKLGMLQDYIRSGQQAGVIAGGK